MATQDKGVKSVTIGNLEAAFAGEAMAHIKYRYFAKLARAAGAEDVAKVFEETEMYPQFRHLAVQEGNAAAVAEFDEQIEESKVHAAAFQRTLEIAAKRFAALANVEERHANHYKATLAKLNAAA